MVLGVSTQETLGFGDGQRPAWLDLDTLREALTDAGFVPVGQTGGGHVKRMVWPGCRDCGSVLHHPGASTDDDRVLIGCECGSAWTIPNVDGPVVVNVPLDWHHTDTAAVAYDAIRRLEQVAGPRVEFGPLTEREAALYQRIAELEANSTAAPDPAAGFRFVPQDLPNDQAGERVTAIHRVDNGRYVGSLWFAEGDSGWRFHLPTPWPGWSDQRYPSEKDALVAFLAAVDAYPTLTPWFDGEDGDG